MALSARTRIGSYEVIGPLGVGGMGEVYRASDTRLRREVALKVVHDGFAADPAHLMHFKREAQVLASFNHPNIAAVYELEESDTGLAIVMELVEGPTLAERIAEGPISKQEALQIATQIAEALEYAHERGIIHRDLKPANVKLTAEGTVKLLDFGLAAPRTVDSQTPALAATQSIRTAENGLILGTLLYMAPEQARGLKVDKRADIWSFGIVLYEMLTRRTPFVGETMSDTIAAVLTNEPDWEPVPRPFRKVLQRCLAKDPKRRLRDVGDVRFALEDVVETEHAVAPASRQRFPMWAALLAVACVGFSAQQLLKGRRLPQHSLAQFTEALPAAMAVRGRGSVISPDGSRLTYVIHGPDGRRMLATRRFDQPRAITLAGTEDATYPFGDPSGQWIGYFAEGKLKKIPAEGGTVISLCDAPNPRGGAWSENGLIVAALSNRSNLSSIPAAGGQPKPLTELIADNQENSHRWPQFLPGGKTVLFTAGVAGGGTFLNTHIESVGLESGKRKTIERNGFFGRYLSSGHLAYMHQGTLFAAPMDPARLQVTGPATPMLEDVHYSETFGEAFISYSDAGIAVYGRGRPERPVLVIQWVDANGRLEPLLPSSGDYSAPRVSPDGKRVALTMTQGGNSDIWIYEWEPEKMTRLTFSPGVEEAPIWSPDGSFIAFHSDKGISWIRSDGSGGVHALTESKRSQYPQSFTSDGKRLVYEDLSPETGLDIWTIAVNQDNPAGQPTAQPEILLRTRSNDGAPALSPDNQWLAYTSDESGKAQVYVRPFSAKPSNDAGTWQVSTGSGDYPIWSRSGQELFYRLPSGGIMAARYKVRGASFVAEKPRVWYGKQFYAVGFTRSFDVTPDGKRFAVVNELNSPPLQGDLPLTVMLNFFTEVNTRVRGGAK